MTGAGCSEIAVVDVVVCGGEVVEDVPVGEVGELVTLGPGTVTLGPVGSGSVEGGGEVTEEVGLLVLVGLVVVLVVGDDVGSFVSVGVGAPGHRPPAVAYTSVRPSLRVCLPAPVASSMWGDGLSGLMRFQP